MHITVKFTGPMRTMAGRAQESISLPAGARVRDLLHTLAATLPPEFARQIVDPLQTGDAATALLLLNTVNLVGPTGLDHPLCDGDVVAFVPPMSGG